MVPVPPHDRKCQCEPGMGSSCFILRTRSQARCTRGYYCPNSPLHTETGNPEWKCSTALPEQHGREAKGMFHTSGCVYIAGLSQLSWAVQYKHRNALGNLSFLTQPHAELAAQLTGLQERGTWWPHRKCLETGNVSCAILPLGCGLLGRIQALCDFPTVSAPEAKWEETDYNVFILYFV